MTTTPHSTGSTSSANRGVKRGLPDTGLNEAEQASQALWNIARLGLTSPRAFAEKLGRRAASGGSWAALMALLRGFGLIRQEGDQIGLSENGQALVNDSDPEKQTAARRAAVLKLKAYRELVTSFDGTMLPDAPTLASRLKYDYGKTDEFALRAATAFIESLSHAGMIDQSGLIRSGGAVSAAVQESTPPEHIQTITQETETETDAEDERYSAEIDEAFSEADADETDIELVSYEQIRRPINLPRSGFPTTNLNVTLDLSKYRAEEVIQILRALRE